MAKRRRSAKRRGMSELSGHKRRKKTGRKRRRGMSESGLSAMFNPSVATATAKAMLSGAVGGAGATLIVDKLMAKATAGQKVGVLAVLGFLAGSVLKMPNLSAGFGATIGRELFSGIKGMSEDADYVDIEKLPRYLQEGRENLAEAYLSNPGYMESVTAYNV